MRHELGIDRAYGAEELFVNGRVERAWLSGIAPDVLQFPGSYGLTIYEAIKDGLIQRIGKLDDNVVHLLGESRVPNQCEAELRVFSCPVPLSERNKVRASLRRRPRLLSQLVMRHRNSDMACNALRNRNIIEVKPAGLT
jgi:hypothetical protein